MVKEEITNAIRKYSELQWKWRHQFFPHNTKAYNDIYNIKMFLWKINQSLKSRIKALLYETRKK